MKWVTREHARVDRIACPWLIRRFIDPGAEILWVPAAEVIATAERIGGTPFDVPDVEYGHHGALCSFDAFVERHDLGRDPALARLALIVRGADTGALDLAPEASGLLAVASGFWEMNIPDGESLALQTPLYDALYVHCGGAPR
ncbi:MAG: chromate resistance protein ChrB domain-containing protein [Tepidiformaceae bacterium]